MLEFNKMLIRRFTLLKQKNEIKANKTLIKILRHTLGKYLKWLFNIKYETNEIKDIKPPYILLANHTNFWDPFFLSVPISKPIHFVASDMLFREGILGWLIKLAGAIPKTKFLSDASTIKSVIRIKNKGGIIGIFPEGERCWDGQTLPILYPTAKLIKSLKIPVVVCVMKGAYLSLPRWSSNVRRGKLTASYSLALQPEHISSMSIDEIYNVICRSLTYDEYTYQKQNMLAFKGKKLAERLEKLLFVCPHCKKADSMHSKDNTFKCSSCGYSVIYNQYGLFHSTSDILYFDNPKEWYKWQYAFLQELISQSINNNSSEAIIMDSGISFRKGCRNQTLENEVKATISLYTDHMNILTDSGSEINLEICRLSSMNIQLNNIFELYHNNTLYSFVFKLPSSSAQRWVDAIRIAQECHAKRDNNGVC